jgi:hypothetical protein
MKKILLGSVIAVSVVFLLPRGAAQGFEAEVVGTVSCPACVAKGARKIDLACARACLTKNKSTDVTKSTSADVSKRGNTDLTDSANSNPAKSTSTDLLIITDDDYKTVPVENPDRIKSHLAHRIIVTGYWTRHGFHVTSVRTL